MSQEMFLRKIPEDMRPWECNVNGVKYVYPAGTEQNVPAEVAAIIDAYWEKQEVDYPETGISFNDLRDRPFGESTEVLFDQRVEFADLGGMMAYMVEFPEFMEADKTYTVTYNGVAYRCQPFDLEDSGFANALGNMAVAGGDDTGEPFLLIINDDEGDGVADLLITSLNSDTSATVKIEKPVVHTIDPKFLPGGGGGKVVLYTDWPYLNKSADLGESTRPSKAEVFEYAKNGGFVVAEPGGSAYYFPLSVGIGGENGERAVVAFYDDGDFNLYSKEYVADSGPET